jgi:hypothetical protein
MHHVLRIGKWFCGRAPIRFAIRNALLQHPSQWLLLRRASPLILLWNMRMIRN